MRVHALHEWEVSVTRAREIQLNLAKRVVTENGMINARFVAGIDISSPDAGGVAKGAVVVLRCTISRAEVVNFTVLVAQ